VLTIKSALLSLQSLLSTPEPKDPQDAEVASMLMKNPEQFQRVAREWAIKYASAPPSTNWELHAAQQSTAAKPKSQKIISREEELRQQVLR
jgi:ubiquitin-conjugating enzyme (huntingtin interacting protein 2)